jgi:hypothetical protein
LRLAKDHFAYIGIYRDTIDTLQQLNKELWKMVMNNKSDPSDITAAIKEIHNLAKTKVLLLRDMPFITRLSKYYDLTLFNNSLPSKFISNFINNKPNSISNLLEKEHKHTYKSFENQFNNDDIKDTIATIDGRKEINNRAFDKHNNIDDEIIEEMQRQSQVYNSLKDENLRMI